MFSDNGILTKAQQSVKNTNKSTIIESIQLDILTGQIDEVNITKSTLEEILEKYGTVLYDTDDNITGLLPNDSDEEIDIADIYSGTLAQETISTTESYVGYYADIDGDGEPEGVIYADLLIDDEGEWGDNGRGTYSYDKIASSKEYTISEEKYTEGPFEDAEIITVAEGSTGADRFYVMALSDFTTTDYETFYWYYTAYSKASLTNPVSYDENDFGTGYTNTGEMITKWTGKTYGEQTAGDIWGEIQDEYANGWFVPSKSEWAAFNAAFSITWENYSSLGLHGTCWTSSEYNAQFAIAVLFYHGYIANSSAKSSVGVRLSRTF